MDLDDLEHNMTRWRAYRLAGRRLDCAGRWLWWLARARWDAHLSPRLPKGISRLSFHVMFQDRRLRVEITQKKATYRLLDGVPVEIIASWRGDNRASRRINYATHLTYKSRATTDPTARTHTRQTRGTQEFITH